MEFHMKVGNCKEDFGCMLESHTQEMGMGCMVDLEWCMLECHTQEMEMGYMVDLE